jgi:hypothetical protein
MCILNVCPAEAQVMLIKNITSKLVNGSRGVMVGWATAGTAILSHSLPPLPSLTRTLLSVCLAAELSALLHDRSRESPYSLHLYNSWQQRKWLLTYPAHPYVCRRLSGLLTLSRFVLMCACVRAVGCL